MTAGVLCGLPELRPITGARAPTRSPRASTAWTIVSASWTTSMPQRICPRRFSPTSTRRTDRCQESLGIVRRLNLINDDASTSTTRATRRDERAGQTPRGSRDPAR